MSRRINLNGIVAYSADNPAHSFTQLYWNGVIEAVSGSLLARENNVIPSVAYEEVIFRYVPRCFKTLQELGCTTPIIVALTLTKVRGLQMGVGPYGFVTGPPIDSETLILPETVVEDFGA